MPRASIKVRPIGLLRMLDDGEQDDELIAVPPPMPVSFGCFLQDGRKSAVEPDYTIKTRGFSTGDPR